MMFIVTEDGHKLPVDDSIIDYENDYIPIIDNVTLLTDDVYLSDCWVLELNRRKWPYNSWKKPELEFVADYYFDHEPTKEEIMWCMGREGLARDGIAFVRKGFILDQEE